MLDNAKHICWWCVHLELYLHRREERLVPAQWFAINLNRWHSAHEQLSYQSQVVTFSRSIFPNGTWSALRRSCQEKQQYTYILKCPNFFQWYKFNSASMPFISDPARIYMLSSFSAIFCYWKLCPITDPEHKMNQQNTHNSVLWLMKLVFQACISCV